MGCSHADWCCLDSTGGSGGILLMWDRRVVERIEEYVGKYLTVVYLKNDEDQYTWAFVGGLWTKR
jgi:hypothetical protein